MPEFAEHPSSNWKNRAYEHLRGAAPARPERFAALMASDQFPRASAYDPVWVWGNQMGPHVLWLADWLTQAIELQPGMRVLDVGCGTAISSIFLAREFGVEVWAADLWVPAADNFARIREAGLFEQVYAVHGEARAYPFQHDFFDAVVSIDSYHYWGGEPGYVDYLARFLKPGGVLGVVVPGDAADAGPLEACGEVVETFHSAAWWRELWEPSRVVAVEQAEMLDGGWDLWWRFVEAGMAWDGADEPGDDAPFLEARDSLGFARLVARRR